MKCLLPAKKMIVDARTKLDLYNAAEWVCDQSRFRFDEQMTYAENAELALLQGKPGVAEFFNMAQVRFDSMERCK